MPTRTQQSDVLITAYASHGDTKHVCLYPATPKECFEMSAEAFDLADFLQTPVIILSDLDLGMNDHMSDAFDWNDERKYNRGKVLTKQDIENLQQRWGRYLDIDGDGVGYRTLPGTHPTKGSYFTRGSSHDEYAAYTESSEAYVRSMQRLEKKWETAKKKVPSPIVTKAQNKAATGAIFFGTSSDAAMEAIEKLSEQGHAIDAMRIRAFPFNHEVRQFIDEHDYVFVIEQNRDAQMKSLLMIELGINPAKLVSILNYDGMPITATFIAQQMERALNQSTVTPLQASGELS
jgi:2-oxoglutarate ferredoxin oxidoreductase subunit alpha